ncbi:hypothetical protein PS925_03772 [Pseudomonas fluorescens]|uniref:Uncharacterized protein n=1 Tax=Pseudomonas fluorescens TaxID=294 RepID=A0A5E6S117_PSEFL|nr:hypothetical protein PS681_01949 [Pseudomonas fluorescens]VVN13188.1 hypothetical protein PS619_03931 [Pseudomonas fluorescens]VVN57927.1 hypothetical protein PS684_02979 [Pseudomonas fluorescens]VVQ13476.1 hypothetical protein PS925_03772 [Pseudomonas fluorescens]
MDSSVFEQTEFLLRATITSAGGLAQQILTDAPIPSVTALAAHQLTETALRGDDTFTRRLLEQAASEVFGIVAGAQARAVEQPFGNANGKALGRSNTGRF